MGLLAGQPLLPLSELCRISEGMYLVEQMEAGRLVSIRTKLSHSERKQLANLTFFSTDFSPFT